MKCPYQTITTHKEEKDENGKIYYQRIIEFHECLGQDCPFYHSRKERDSNYQWVERVQCKRADNEKR